MMLYLSGDMSKQLKEGKDLANTIFLGFLPHSSYLIYWISSWINSQKMGNTKGHKSELQRKTVPYFMLRCCQLFFCTHGSSIYSTSLDSILSWGVKKVTALKQVYSKNIRWYSIITCSANNISIKLTSNAVALQKINIKTTIIKLIVSESSEKHPQIKAIQNASLHNC